MGADGGYEAELRRTLTWLPATLLLLPAHPGADSPACPPPSCCCPKQVVTTICCCPPTHVPTSLPATPLLHPSTDSSACPPPVSVATGGSHQGGQAAEGGGDADPEGARQCTVGLGL